MTRPISTFLAAIAVLAGVLVSSTPVRAAEVNAEISAPDQVVLGETVEVNVTLTTGAANEPVPDATVTLTADASFGGVDGSIELSSAITDDEGVAVLAYTPRVSGERELRVEYLAPDATEPESTTWIHTVTGSTQLYQSKAGIKVPGLGVWVLMAVLAIVWGILFVVAFLVLEISRAGDVPQLHPAAPGTPPSSGGGDGDPAQPNDRKR